MANYQPPSAANNLAQNSDPAPAQKRGAYLPPPSQPATEIPLGGLVQFDVLRGEAATMHFDGHHQSEPQVGDVKHIHSHTQSIYQPGVGTINKTVSGDFGDRFTFTPEAGFHGRVVMCIGGKHYAFQHEPATEVGRGLVVPPRNPQSDPQSNPQSSLQKHPESNSPTSPQTNRQANSLSSQQRDSSITSVVSGAAKEPEQNESLAGAAKEGPNKATVDSGLQIPNQMKLPDGQRALDTVVRQNAKEFYAEVISLNVPAGSEFFVGIAGKNASGADLNGVAEALPTGDYFKYIPGGVSVRRIPQNDGTDQILIGRYAGFTGDLTLHSGADTRVLKAEAAHENLPKLPVVPSKPVSQAGVSDPTADSAARGAAPAENRGAGNHERQGLRVSESLHESTPTSFRLKAYLLPSPDQLGAGSCLYMSATGIAEFLLNKASGVTNPKIGGPTDLSEQWTLALSQRVPLQNNYTDAVDLLVKGGYVRDAQLRFRAYAGSSWMSEGHPHVDPRAVSNDLPRIEKQVLFSAGGEGTQQWNGVMTANHLEQIKTFLRESESPVLFVYKPPGVNYWHANIVTGYDDVRQTLTVRDSSFGSKVTNEPPYTYDGRSPWGAIPYRGECEMSYQDVLRWGNHATGYRLAGASDGRLATSN